MTIEEWQVKFNTLVAEGIRDELFVDFVFSFYTERGGGTIASTVDKREVLNILTRTMVNVIKKEPTYHRVVAVDVDTGESQEMVLGKDTGEVN